MGPPLPYLCDTDSTQDLVIKRCRTPYRTNGRSIRGSHFNGHNAEGSVGIERKRVGQVMECHSTLQKRNLTLSVAKTALNTESRTTVKFTTPSNSRSIRATSYSTRRRSSVAPSSKLKTDRLTRGEGAKSSRMVDRRREVAGLTVERAMGIQTRPPPVRPARKPSFTSWRFGSLEKSKDRSKASTKLSASGNGISGFFFAWIERRRGVYHEQ